MVSVPALNDERSGILRRLLFQAVIKNPRVIELFSKKKHSLPQITHPAITKLTNEPNTINTTSVETAVSRLIFKAKQALTPMFHVNTDHTGDFYRLSLSPSALKPLKDIQIYRPLVEGNMMQDKILKPTILTWEDFSEILTRKDFKDSLVTPVDIHGIATASDSEEHNALWTRDLAAIGLAKLEMGDDATAVKIAQCLYKAYSRKDQREIMQRFINDPNGAQNIWRANYPPNNVPGTKFDIRTEGESRVAVRTQQDWGLQQIDAYGYFLLLVSKLALAGKLDIETLDRECRGKRDGQDSLHHMPVTEESTLVAMLKFLMKLPYHTSPDVGAWEGAGGDIAEPFMQMQRTSSLAACQSAFIKLQELLQAKASAKSQTSSSLFASSESFDTIKAQMQDAIKKGDQILGIREHQNTNETETRIGAKYQAIEVSPDPNIHRCNGAREKDLALLFVLMMSDTKALGLTENQENAIIRTLEDLEGTVAHKRFDTDIYSGSDWHLGTQQTGYHHRNSPYRLGENLFEPAEWCFSNAYLAAFFYKRYITKLHETKKEDMDSLFRADHYSRRALAAVSQETKYLHKSIEKGHQDDTISVPTGQVCELYFKDTQQGKWNPGKNYGLNWTRSAYQLMFFYGAQASYAHTNKHKQALHGSIVEAKAA